MRYCWMLALTARAARGLARTSATTSATAPNKVVFVGAGSFGSAMALVAARAQPDASIKIWARRDAVVDEINEQRRNGRYLPEDADPFPSNVEATTDLYLAKRAKRHRVMARAVTDAVDGACLFVFPLCYGVAMIVLFNVEFRDSYADVDDGEVLEPNFHAGEIALKTCVFVFALLAATAAYHKAPDVRA